jgi:hypothetical protein
MLAAALSILLSMAPGTPPGFRPASEVEIWRLGEIDYLKDTFYEASLVGDKLRIESRSEMVARQRKEMSRLVEPEPMHKIHLGGGYALWSPGTGTRVSDGWIAGWDMGEFGGGLYWFPPKGEKLKRIDKRNTRFITSTPKGLFAFQSLAHMQFSYSRFVKIEKGGDAWSVRLVTDLHDVPSEFLFDKTRFIYIAREFVSTVEFDGSQRLIYRSVRELFTGGFCRRRNGEIWTGTSRAILCLTPDLQGGYRPFWFRPIHRG